MPDAHRVRMRWSASRFGRFHSPRMLCDAMESLHAPRNVVALSFDGIVANSEFAWTCIAWRAAATLWPQLTCAAGTLSPRDAGVRLKWVRDSSELEGQSGNGMPEWLAVKMRKLRPAIQSEYEMLLLLRLCIDEALASKKSTRGMRPLSAGEIESSWAQLRESVLFRCATSKHELALAYEQASSEWRFDEPSAWSDAHGLRLPVVSILREALRAQESSFFLLATNPGRALDLLDDAGLTVPAEQVVAASGARQKAEAVRRLLANQAASHLHFVDMHAGAIRTVAADARLLRARLYFASWGYSSAAQASLVATMPRVGMLSSTIDLEQLLLQ